MTTELGHHQMQDLLAAYALDAVPDEDAESIELHLRECPRCRAEVAEHRETAAHLAMGHESAPSDVWDRIAAGLEETPPPVGLVVPLAARRQRRWQRFLTLPAVAAAAAVTVLTGVVVNQGAQLDDMQASVQDRTLLSSALAIQSRSDARRVELRSGDGAVLAHAVMTPDGTGFVWSDGLPAVADSRTYQLWAVVEGEKVSAGVLGSDPDLVPFHVSGSVGALAITEEVSGGVTATEQQPVVTGLLQTA